MSARGSRFLLPGWASAGEARGGRQRGCPDLVLGDLRGGRSALSLPTMPCDCPRGTAGADESHAGNSCCSAGPPRPPSPLCLSPLPGGPSSARPVAPAPERGREWRGYPGRHPSAGSWPAVHLGRRDAGPRARLRPSWRDVRSHNLVHGGLFIAEGRARGALSRWHCQPALCSPAVASPHQNSCLLLPKRTR